MKLKREETRREVRTCGDGPRPGLWDERLISSKTASEKEDPKARKKKSEERQKSNCEKTTEETEDSSNTP